MASAQPDRGPYLQMGEKHGEVRIEQANNALPGNFFSESLKHRNDRKILATLMYHEDDIVSTKTH